MQTVYIGNTLINDIFLGSQRMEDALQNPNLTIDWLLVGGGGSGGTFGNRTGGSGGAGRFVSSSANITAQSISITIGNGGASVIYTGAGDQGNDGIQSTIVIAGTTYTAPGGVGGGAGLNTGNTRNGRDGGSGGGSNGGTAGNAVAGSPISGFGNNGSNTGAGGGAGGTPTGLAWLDGITYSVGGGGGGSTAGCGGAGTGIGSNSGGGNNGIVKIRYYGTPKASGGTITQSGGYTYHTFTSNGTFTY